MRDTDHQRDKRKKLIIGIFIAAVMILSTFGFVMEYAMTSAGHTESYGGIKFEQSGTTVVARINGKQVEFGYFPSQVNTITSDPDAINLLRTASSFYVTSDPKDTYAQNIDDISLYLVTELPQLTQTYPVVAFTNATGYDRPQVTCENASATLPVVHFFRGNTTSLTLEGDCIQMSAYSPQDVYRLANRLVYIKVGVTDG